ncbi:ImmA/IrrE family metallo-endopeptidase [Paenibacillus sp. P3E]|uniref:ImmA/IrrE family metallo-endopeptidase n=1 Tax=Paenibacillus TaxID=44249 RepID=UPI0035318983
MLGYYNSSRRLQMIHINNTASQQDQRFTCAHELGHVILHPNVNTPFLRRLTLILWIGLNGKPINLQWSC